MRWVALGGTAYLTQSDSSNPICGGRDLDALFAADYVPGDLPGRTIDLPTIDLPEGSDAARVDRDIVIEATTARLRDQGVVIGVRGYFFGQCGVEPQVQVREDADLVHVTIYRVIPEGMSCTGGVQPFSLVLPPVTAGSLKVGDRFPVNTNGQIIAILIGL
jgi:hypothetical protein